MAYVYEWLPGLVSLNQGNYSPDMIFERVRHIIMTPLDYVLTPDNVANLQTKLQADAILNDKYSRIQVISGIGNWEPDNSNAQTLDFNDGSSQQVYGSQYAMTYGFKRRDVYSQILRQRYNGQASNVLTLLIDESGNLWGTQGTDASGNKVIKGFSLESWLANNIPMDGGSGMMPTVRVSWSDAAEFNDRLLGYPANVTMASVKNVGDVTVQLIAGPSSNTVSLAFMHTGSITGMNLAQRYATILAANPSLLIAKNHGTGQSITVSGAVTAQIGGQSVITYTLSATNYPTSGGSLDLSLAAPSVLATALIKYFETPYALNVLIP